MPGSSGKVAKKLPKRCTNDRKKATRQRSWNRTQEKKRKRREEQEARHRANVERGITVHEQKKVDAKRRKGIV